MTTTDSITPLKLCKTCGNSYPETADYWHRGAKCTNGLRATCKECCCAKQRQRNLQRDPEKDRAYRKQYRESNQEKIREYMRVWSEVNKEKQREYARQYRLNNYEHELERSRKYREVNRDQIRERARAHFAKNRDNILAQQRRRIAANPEPNRTRAREYYHNNKEVVLEKARQRTALNPEPSRKRAAQWKRENPERARAHSRAYAHRRRIMGLDNGGTHSADDVALQLAAQTDKRGVIRCWWCNGIITDTYHVDHRIPLSRGGHNSPENLCVTCPSCNLSKSNKLPQEWNGRLL